MQGFGNIAKHASDQIGKKYKVRDKAPDYKDFFPEAFNVLEPGTKLKHNWHIDFLCDKLQAEMERIARGEPKQKDLIINIMPRSLKSYITTILLNAWTWTKFPEMKFITISYASPLSIEHSGKTRDLLKSDWFQDHYGDVFDLSKSQDSKGYFRNTKGGERKASSVGGQLTGSGGNVLVFDDPVKPPQKDEVVVNLNEILSANKWHDSTAYNRVNDPVVDLRIYVMQRLHNNDMTGYLLAKENQDYEHICIPGELTEDAKPDQIKKFYMPDREYEGKKLFFRDRFPKQVLLTYEENMGDNYSGQVLQSPSKEGGGTWKEEYFIPILREDLPPRMGKSGTGWDLATSKKQKKSNSSSAYVHGFRWQGDVFITECDWFFLEFPELIEKIKKLPEPHWIENKSSGKQAVPQLKADGIMAEENPNKNRDKFQMASFGAAQAKRVNVYVVEDIWDKLLTNKKQGILEFPSATWDDLHDALCVFLENITDGMISREDVQEVVQANRRLNSTKKRSSASIGAVSRGSSFRGNSI